MTIHHQLKPHLTRVSAAKAPASPWLFSWPNTADFNFNYYHLLQQTAQTGIGTASNNGLRIAVIGAGIAGLTAARELYRSGFPNIDIYESTNRLGGRTYSFPAAGQSSCYELGAMRLPFFNPTGVAAPGTNSALAWYATDFNVAIQPFPDPGGAVANTGIYLNQGYGPVNQPAPGQKPTMLLWPANSEGNPPPTPELAAIYNIWSAFADQFIKVVSAAYATEAWQPLWQAIVSNYWEINFRDFAYLPVLATYDPTNDPGNFGGLGLTEDQATLLYTIGVGDGSWGAFYDISVLYVMRTILFGYGNDHQLIQGLFNSNGDYAGGPEAGLTLTDSAGNQFQGPNYLGVNTFADCMFFQPVQSAVAQGSLYDAMKAGIINLYTSTNVTALTKGSGSQVIVSTANGQKTYDAVILSPTTWQLQIGTSMSGFDPVNDWPFQVQTSFATSHWIRSAKVMFPLKQRYWENSDIPQLISTDTQLQGVYAWAVGSDPGILLASYTWEDDANKFIAQGFDPSLATSLLKVLDEILLRCTNIGQAISPFVDETQPPVIMQWSLMPSYLACAKLYHERSWDIDYALLRYNQSLSVNSGLYFAGEGFSVEGGWTEPAIRMGLDAALHVINNSGGTFNGGFDFATDYPLYTDWSPYVGSSDAMRAGAAKRRV